MSRLLVITRPNLVDGFRLAGVEPTVLMEAGTSETMMHMVAAGLGLGFGPRVPFSAFATERLQPNGAPARRRRQEETRACAGTKKGRRASRPDARSRKPRS